MGHWKIISMSFFSKNRSIVFKPIELWYTTKDKSEIIGYYWNKPVNINSQNIFNDKL
jgi:hypothetical protein